MMPVGKGKAKMVRQSSSAKDEDEGSTLQDLLEGE